MPKIVKNNVSNFLLLFVSVSFAFAWVFSETTSAYNLQAIAFLAIVYLLLKLKERRQGNNTKPVYDLFLLTTAIFIIVFSTGSLSSPLFFLIYFLLFGTALILAPNTSLLLSLISVVFFLLTPNQDIFRELLLLGSLLLISPLASIFGNQYKKTILDEQRIALLSLQEEKLETEVVRQEKEVNRWAQKELKEKLAAIWEEVDQLASQKGLGEAQKERVKNISKRLSDLLASGKKMQDEVAK